MKSSTEIDSKFRFVIVAAKRAKQLIAGSKPKIKSKSKNPIRIAQMEVNMGLVPYDIIEPKKDQVRKPEEEGFIGEKIREISEEPIKKYKGKAKKKVAKPKDKPKDKAKDKPKDKPKDKAKDKPKDKPKDKAKDKPKDKAKEKPKKKNKGDKT
ncbi:MAG TPA: DNA-directed RNA polymerase subunit omega [Candidatus Aminicenantes bacterium]|nr:DNA-directed RNA polymerase subunit omega [Candidatus Aminicenantes bacterium]